MSPSERNLRTTTTFSERGSAPPRPGGSTRATAGQRPAGGRSSIHPGRDDEQDAPGRAPRDLGPGNGESVFRPIRTRVSKTCPKPSGGALPFRVRRSTTLSTSGQKSTGPPATTSKRFSIRRDRAGALSPSPKLPPCSPCGSLSPGTFRLCTNGCTKRLEKSLSCPPSRRSECSDMRPGSPTARHPS